MALIRNISDTARWAAVFRARETERPNPLFHDPFARRLAGERGEQIARSLVHSEKSSWSWITNPVDVRSMFSSAGRLKRLTLILSILYYLQRSEAFNAKRPWAGVC